MNGWEREGNVGFEIRIIKWFSSKLIQNLGQKQFSDQMLEFSVFPKENKWLENILFRLLSGQFKNHI